jgi:acetate kinase
VPQIGWLGVTLVERANASNGPCISTPDSRVSVWVIPTNEELMIAQHTLALIRSEDRKMSHDENRYQSGQTFRP